MEIDIPVWTIRPNWKEGITERLEWLTDVIPSSIGVEQRRSVRLSPRRSFEINFDPYDRERSYFDLILQRLGSVTWLLPVWHDQARLRVGSVGGSNRLNFDNTNREFVVGDYAILLKDAFTWEAVLVQAQDVNGITLSVPLEDAWPVGASLFPLVPVTLDPASRLTARSSRIGSSTMLFTVDGPNDWPALTPGAGASYAGEPVIVRPPNRSADVSADYSRLAFERDGRLGRRRRFDNANRAFTVQSHSWVLHGRAAQADFRSTLYWLRGRQRAVWLPSFNDDIRTSRVAVAGTNNLDVERIGLTYVGLTPGREVILLDGLVYRATSIGPPQSAQEDRLKLSGVLGQNIPKGRSGSFLTHARLAQDTLELNHMADSDGLLEVVTTFRSIP